MPVQYEYGAGLHAETVRLALEGRTKTPPQGAFAVAWVTFAFYMIEADFSFERLVANADDINHAVVTPDEVAWAFLHLRARGWLEVKGDRYSLTSEGRRTIEETVNDAPMRAGTHKLEMWFESHPVTGEDQ